MLIELIAIALVGACIIVVVLGHVLLVDAIYRCVREDYVGGRGHRARADDAATADSGMKPLPLR